MGADTTTDRPDKWTWLASFLAMMTDTDRHNYRHFSGWLTAWALTFIAATLMLDAGIVRSQAANWLVAAAPNLLAFATVASYLRFLRGADELMRRVQLEGLALGFGVGLFFAMGYRLLERAGAHGLDINDVTLPMLLAWCAGQWLALRRYR